MRIAASKSGSSRAKALWIAGVLGSAPACGAETAPNATLDVRHPPAPRSAAVHERWSGDAWTHEQPEVRAFLQRVLPSVKRACLVPAFIAEPGLAARGVKIANVVELRADGSVASVRSTSDTHPEIAACVGGKLEQWVFPHSDHGGTLTFPIIGLSAG